MRPATRRLARLTVFGGSALAVGALAFACSLQSDTTSPKAGPIPVTDNQNFFEYQVEKPAQLLPGSPAPKYPEQLRLANIEGKLTTRFVVDTSGRPMAETFQVLERSDDRFVPSVRAAVPMLRFTPAAVGGKPVKQVVEMPFSFTLSKDAAPGLSGAVTFSQKHFPQKAEAHAGSPGFRGTTTTTLPKGVYFEYQVEQPASPLPSNTPPRYPTELRRANVEGEVMAQFIVNEDGLADSTTFQVVRATNEEFARTVRASVSSFRFSPALVGGHPVKQLVQMPFTFDLSKK
jgi:TonB family protein